jgi:capsular exopolysaccharide synthesis family protein
MTLLDFVNLIRGSWWRLALISALGAAIGLGWASTQPRLYSAAASAIVATGPSEDIGTALVASQFAQSRVQSYLSLVQSRTVADYAIDKLELKETASSLVSRVYGWIPDGTSVLKISASAESPEDALTLAEAWVEGMILAVDKLEMAGTLGGNARSIVHLVTLESASLPQFPSSPNFRQAVLFGGIAGLVGGFGYVLLRLKLDFRVRSVKELEDTFEVSVIGTLPFNQELSKKSRGSQTLGENSSRSRNGDRDKRLLSEAYRKLRTNLSFMNVDNPPKSIVITSSLPNEGKSTATLHLAESIADSGETVIVIDADLRRRGLAKAFGALESPGLTDVLVHRVDVDKVLQPVGSTGRLFVLAAGVVPPNPSELLSSNTFSVLLEKLTARGLVIIDAPPLLPVTDAAILAAKTDGALLLVRAGSTNLNQVRIAVNNILRINGKLLGIVLNRVPKNKAMGSYYGYSYYGEYYGNYYGDYYVDEESSETVRRKKKRKKKSGSESAS